MYATIRWDEGVTAATDELAREAQALAARLGALPGFLACLHVATEEGGGALVCLWEDRASLAAAGALLAGWSLAGQPALWGAAPRQYSGEVIAQRGL